MQQTPIEKASNEIEIKLNAKYANSDMHKGYKAGLQFALSVLNDWKSYEKQHLRDVAEKAIDFTYKSDRKLLRGSGCFCVPFLPKPDYIETYLNQNHPL